MIQLTARIVPGRPHEFAIAVPADYEGAFAHLRERCRAGFVTLRLTEPHRPRTTGEGSQNHHLNGHVQQLCVETGNDFGVVKMAVKMAALDRGYPFSTFRGAVVPKSEADASTIECGMLIDAVHQIAAEMGIILAETEA